DQRALDAVPLERGQSLVSRVALGDAPEVEQHRRFQELDGARGRVEAQFLIAYEFERLGQTVRVGQLVPAARPPPQLHDGTHRDVERSVRPPGQILGCGEYAEQVLADRDRRAARARA